VRGAGLISKDFGGPTHQSDLLFERNTFVNTSFDLSPTRKWIDDDFPDDPSNITFRGNVVAAAYTQNENTGMINIGTYGSDEDFAAIRPAISLSNNCYWNVLNPAEEVKFNMMGAPNFGTTGGTYSLAEWQALGYDLDSDVANPQLTAQLGPASDTVCAGRGARVSYSSIVENAAAGTGGDGEKDVLGPAPVAACRGSVVAALLLVAVVAV